MLYALQTSETGRHGDELYSTSNRQPADGLASLPRDYTGPVLGPPLPGDLGRPMLDAQSKGQPVVPPTIATPMVDEAEQRRRAEEEAARTSRVFFQTEQSTAALAETPPEGTSPPTVGPNRACPTPVVPLTTDLDKLRTAAAQMQEWNGSGTNVSEGLSWGMRVLSPDPPYTDGAAWKAPDTSKIVVLLTDGENVVFGASNEPEKSD